jgi:DNA ligase (NAD+)
MSEMKDTRSRILELRQILNEHNYLYHVVNAPKISDAEYDKLFQELLSLEKLHPELADVNSPTARVGYASPNSFKKVKHRSKMLSLDNTFTGAEVIKFLGKGEEVHIEPKIDGCSLELIYEQGKLVSAATRGDGTSGDDVTANVRTIYTVPLELTEKVDLRVRGEVYMTFTVFNRLNQELAATGEDLLANPRNAAAGAIKLKDPYEVSKRQLSFVAYASPDEIKGIETQAQLVEHLQGLGFISITCLPTIQDMELPDFVATLESEKSVEELIKAMDVYRKQLDFPTDGLVFKLNSLAKQRDLGEGTRAPNWATAFKFPPERKATKLNAITVTIGKTGRCTPNAELAPISLSGTMVTAASLCNQDEVERLGINVGDEVLVEKSAEIIPKVMGVHKKHSKGHWKMPAKCPSCDHPIVRPEGFVDYYCENNDCPEQVLARLKHATGKSALDIDGCGEVTVRELMEHGVRTLSDIFTISELGFLKPAARKKFIEGREHAKAQPLWRKIHALGIEGVGRTVSQEIAGRWNALYAVFDELPQLKEVIGESLFESWTRWFDRNAEEIDKLQALGFHFESDAKTAGPLTGKFFVITGTLVSGKRDEVVRRIEEAGGTVKSAVSKNVHYLVAGADCGKTKTDAAKKVGTTVITEEQLYQLMGKPMPIITAEVDPDREF